MRDQQKRTAPGDWNATSYDRVADPQTRWGAEVLERLPLEGDETVLDAGCGTGRVTELLLARLPRGRVVALDFSAAMLGDARGRLARFGNQVTYVQADLGQPLPLHEPVDAILSTATFHWVMDHDALFANLASVLRPGGLLVAQCGGFGNVATLLDVARQINHGFRREHNFQTPEATAARLESNGFEDIQAWLSDAPTRFDPGAPFEAFLETVCLRTFLDDLPPADRDPFVKAVAARMPEPLLDYVRLNIVARRSASEGSATQGAAT
ncbi:MAG TPA: methyltransferase domain-containing protein [Candidatus Limnocylindria bacterium]|nr:methyltransferase domain-containing protein [Candidatus Limnocylindria bacterium]